MGKYSKLICICALFALLVPFAAASRISLQITSGANDTASSINVTHLGDEPAYQVQIVSKILDKKYEGPIRERLDVGQSVITPIPLNFSTKRSGMYPLLTTIYYQDANGYSFSALNAKLVKNTEATRSEINLDLGDAQIKTVTQAKVTVKNMGEETRDVHLFLFTPDELVVKDNNRGLTIGPKSSATATFDIVNLGARAGSTYVFYAVAEYDGQNGHAAAINSANIRVLLEKNKFFDTKGIIIALAIVALVIIVLQFVRKKK